jgi:hypothetical protein
VADCVDRGISSLGDFPKGKRGKDRTQPWKI